MTLAPGLLRIGELSRRTGVAPELLRAWERRYGLLRPSRSSGGFRLYSAGDEQRIELMREHLRRGLAAAEAARLAVEGAAERAGEDAADASVLQTEATRLRAALDGFDERSAQAALDALLSAFTPETVLSEVLLPYLSELGDR
jgi:DNA-binding transcriptional MerR regulator